jgi:hypothetical protein
MYDILSTLLDTLWIDFPSYQRMLRDGWKERQSIILIECHQIWRIITQFERQRKISFSWPSPWPLSQLLPGTFSFVRHYESIPLFTWWHSLRKLYYFFYQLLISLKFVLPTVGWSVKAWGSVWTGLKVPEARGCGELGGGEGVQPVLPLHPVQCVHILCLEVRGPAALLAWWPESGVRIISCSFTGTTAV